MTAESPTIRLERYSERHVEGLTALYNDPAVARQVLQMPYQSVEQRRKRLHDSADDDRLLILVALHQGDVIGSASLEQHPRIRRSHSGSIGMGVAVAWQGKGVGSRLLGELLDIADNWMNLRRVELTVYTDNAPALALYRKFGFETEGEMRDYAVRDGRFVDVYSMARLRRVEGREGASRGKAAPLSWAGISVQCRTPIQVGQVMGKDRVRRPAQNTTCPDMPGCTSPPIQISPPICSTLIRPRRPKAVPWLAV